MPDIAMCGTACPRSTTCKRHPDSGTKPSEWQHWGGFTAEGCEYYVLAESEVTK